jgi:hypothetical protein
MGKLESGMCRYIFERKNLLPKRNTCIVICDVEPVLELRQLVEVSCVVGVSEIRTVSIFKVKCLSIHCC